MSLKIGRAGMTVPLGEVEGTPEEDGDKLRISGRTRYGSVVDALILRAQLLGLKADEFQPLVWDEFPDLKGYYVVEDVQVGRPVQTLHAGIIPWSVSLVRIKDSAAPVMELGVLGGVRVAEPQVFTNWHKNPFFAGAAGPVNRFDMTSLAIISDAGNNVAKGEAAVTGNAAMLLMPFADRPAAVEGEQWWAVLTIKNAAAAPRNFWATLDFFDLIGATSGTYLTTITSPPVTIAAGASQEIVLSGYAPADTASVSVGVVRNNGAVGDLVYVDNVYLSKDAPLTDPELPKVFAGTSVAPSTAVTYAWTGTANASPSTCTIVWAGNQVITNWHKNPHFVGSAAPVATSSMTQAGIITDSGNRVGKASAVSSATASMRLMPNADRPAAAAGQVWYGKATVKNPTSKALEFLIYLEFANTVGGTFGTSLQVSPSFSLLIDPGQKFDFNVSAIAPSGTASVAIGASRVNNPDAAAGNLIFVDNVFLSRTPVDSTFSGDTPDTAEDDYAWTGTANASTSTRTTVRPRATFRPYIPIGAFGVSATRPGDPSSTRTPTLATRNGDSSAVRGVDMTAGRWVVQYSCPPEKYFDGAATLLLNDQVVVGTQIPNAVDNWMISNDIFQIRNSHSETTGSTFEMRQAGSSGWSAWVPFSIFGSINSITVLRNTPEAVGIRLRASFSMYGGFPAELISSSTSTIDIVVQRGQKFAAITINQIVTGTSASLAFDEQPGQSGQVIDHGVYVPATDAWFLSPHATSKYILDRVSLVPSTVRSELQFGVGFGADQSEYKAAMTANTRVVVPT